MALAGTDAGVIEGRDLGAVEHGAGGHGVRPPATLIEFPTPDETIAAVRNGEADAVLADKDFLMTYHERIQRASWCSSAK
jgi:polar amino acid transport system substrate-binding protein